MSVDISELFNSRTYSKADQRRVSWMSHSGRRLPRRFSHWSPLERTIGSSLQSTNRIGTEAFSVLITFSPLARGVLLMA